jgi:Arc/MetJ-type ribon-helix-helix transcriptional regulator
VAKTPRKKKFEVRIEVLLPAELASFLEGMVREGVADSISQAARKAIAFAKNHMHEEAET